MARTRFIFCIQFIIKTNPQIANERVKLRACLLINVSIILSERKICYFKWVSLNLSDFFPLSSFSMRFETLNQMAKQLKKDSKVT